MKKIGIDSYIQEETCFNYDDGAVKGKEARPGRALRAGRTAPQDIIDLAGARNVASGLDTRWDKMGWESVAKADPDVVIDYDKEPLANKLIYLKKQSPIKDSPTVKNDRIWVLDYGKAVSGPTNVETAEKFATYLDEKGIK